MRYKIILSVFIFFSYNFLLAGLSYNDLSVYPIEKIASIKYGNKEGELGIGKKMSPTGDLGPGPIKFSKDNRAYIVDIFNSRLNIYDDKFHYLSKIDIVNGTDFFSFYIHYEIINDLGNIFISSSGHDGNEIIYIQKNGVFETLLANNARAEVLDTNNYFSIDDIFLYYDKNDLRYINLADRKENGLYSEKFGEKYYWGEKAQNMLLNTEAEDLGNLQSFLKMNNTVLSGNRLLAGNFDVQKKYWAFLNEKLKIIRKNNKKYNLEDVESAMFLDFDKDDNSYWDATFRTFIGTLVMNRYGEIIDIIQVVLPAVSPNGDLYYRGGDGDISKTNIYKITRRWGLDQKISDASTKTTDAVKTIPSVAFAAKATSLTATSFIDYQSMYTPYRVFDGDPKTAWLEAAKGSGIDEAITLTLDKEITVDEIRFMPGYFDKQWWNANNRIRKLTAESAGKVLTFTFDDTMVEQGLKLSSPITFTKIRFSIKEVYRSTGDDDTALSEIAFYNAGKKVELDMSGVK